MCFSTLACPSWSLGQILEAAENFGIQGIDFRGVGHEIDITKLPAFSTDLETTLSDVRRRNLLLPCYNTSITLMTPASERWQMMLEECQRYATLAEKSNTKFLRIFGGAVPKEMTHAQGVMLGQRHLKQLIKICRPAGCKVLLETHDDWSRSNECMELVGEFETSDVGVLWDLEHPYRKSEAPNDTAQGLGNFLQHVHIKDSIPVDGKNIPKLLGEGNLPLKELLGALKAVNYSGWICLETEKRWFKDAPEPEVCLPQFVEFMRGYQG